MTVIRAVHANHSVMKWARESAGLSIDKAAQKIGVKIDQLGAWERGEEHPTIRQLEQMAWVYRRSLGGFFLEDVPEDISFPNDFRRLAYADSKPLTPNLRFEIRRVHNRREAAIELHEVVYGELPKFTVLVHRNESADKVAKKIRDALGVTREEHLAWPSDPHLALRAWSKAIERLNVLVLQLSRVAVDEMRGFSISAEVFPVVAVNGADAPRGRIFTLHHELVHVALRSGGLCNPQDQDGPDDSVSQVSSSVEVFCNQVAGAVLVPKSTLLSHPVVVGSADEMTWSDADLSTLSRDFKVSEEVVLRRLLSLGRTSHDFYVQRRSRYLAMYRQGGEEKRSGRFPPHRRAIRDNGASYTQPVLDAHNEGHITLRDVSKLLGVRLKHLAEIEEAMRS